MKIEALEGCIHNRLLWRHAIDGPEEWAVAMNPLVVCMRSSPNLRQSTCFRSKYAHTHTYTERASVVLEGQRRIGFTFWRSRKVISTEVNDGNRFDGIWWYLMVFDGSWWYLMVSSTCLGSIKSIRWSRGECLCQRLCLLRFRSLMLIFCCWVFEVARWMVRRLNGGVRSVWRCCWWVRRYTSM